MIKQINGDIVNLPFKVGAIVNPSNADLWLGSGVSGAIKAKAGKDAEKLQNDMNQLKYETGNKLKIGDCVITNKKYGDINADAIIHVSGPKISDSNWEKMLHYAYSNCCKIAIQNGIKSIAFPLISAGIFGIPSEISLKIAQEELNKYQDLTCYIVIYSK